MLSYNASLKDAIDEINKGLEMLKNLVWTENSITRMPVETVKEFMATDPNYLLNEIFDIPESGKYKIQIAGKGITNYTVKSPKTGKVIYTEKNIDDSYETSDLILGKGDQLYINSSPDTGEFVRIQLIRECTFLELFQELHDNYLITKRELEGKIENIPIVSNAVLEGWFSDGDTPLHFYAKDDTEKLQPIEPSEGKIYINLLNNVPYRWGGEYYTVVGGKYLAIGETPTTAFSGSRGVAVETKVGHSDVSKFYSGSVTDILKTKMENPSIFILPNNPVTFPSQPEIREIGKKYLIDYSTQDIYDLFDSYVGENIGGNVFLRKVGKDGITNSLGEIQDISKGIIGYASAVETGTDLGGEIFAIPTTEAVKDDNLPIKRYRIQRKLRNKNGFVSQKYGRILITCCTHGLEKMGIPVMLNLLESIKLQNNPMILDLLTYFDIDIVPCVNPSGINQCIGKTISELEGSSRPGRRNGRGVNINRNFQRGWSNASTGTGTVEYKGPFPISEQESIALNNIYSENYCLMIDLHTTSYSGINWISQIVTDGWDLQKIFSTTLEQMQTRLVNVYGRDIISEMVRDGVGTEIISATGNNPFTICDFTDIVGGINTSAIFEMPKIQNSEDGSKYFYSEESQLYSTEIILTFLYNYYKYVVAQGKTPRTTYEMEKLTLYSLEDNLLSMEPRDWTGGSVDSTQFWSGLKYRGVIKSPIKIKKGTTQLFFKNLSPLYTTLGDNRQNSWKLYVNYGQGTQNTLPNKVGNWTEVKFGDTCELSISPESEYVWIYFKVLDSIDNEVNIRTSEIGITYIFSLKYPISTEKIDIKDFFNTLHSYYISIPKNSNLNTIITEGVYYSEGSVITSTLINIPAEIAYGFRLEVSKLYGKASNGITQTIRYQDSIYTRTLFEDSTWGSWKKILGETVTSKTE